MVRGGSKKRRPRRRPSFSIFNAFEGFAFLNLATTSFMGTNAISFFTGGDKSFGNVYDEGEKISLTSMLANPEEAFAGIMSNVKENSVQFLIQSVMLGVGFRLARRLTSKARSKINSYMIRPALGRGVSI